MITPGEHPLQPARPTVIVTTGRWWRFRGLPPDVRAMVKERYSIRNARRTQQMRYTGRPNRDEPETIEAYLETDQGDLLIAPGVAGFVIDGLRKLELEVAQRVGANVNGWPASRFVIMPSFRGTP